MAILKAEVKFNFEPIQKLAKIYPEINARFLSLVGKRSRTLLKMEALSKGVRLTDGKRSQSPLFMIMSDVQTKKSLVKVYSHPLMLFENGRTLRDGSKESGRKIYPALKTSVMSRMGTYVKDFENKILEPELRKLDL